MKHPSRAPADMAAWYIWVIRFLHVLSGVAWVGGAFFWAMVIAPRVLARGPPPLRRPFLEAVLGGVTRYFYVAGAMTIVTGFWVLGLLGGFSNIGSAFRIKGYGTALGLGVVMAVGMLIEGVWIITPTAKKLLAMMQALPTPEPGAPPTPPAPEVQAEMAKLGKELGMASMTSVLMGTIAIGAMTWAVNSIHCGVTC